MKAKEIVELALNSGARFEIFDPEVEVAIASDESLRSAYIHGFDKLLELEVESISVVDTTLQPRTLQIYTKAD